MSEKTECEILLDRIEKLPLVPRASALIRILRNVVDQMNNDSVLYPDELEAHILSVASEHRATKEKLK